MKFKALFLSVVLAATLFVSSVSAQDAVRFMWYADSEVQTETMQDLVSQFMIANPGIEVELDVVPYSTITDNLPLLLETGEGPDLARVTNLGGLSEYYADMGDHVDGDYWMENFGPYLKWLDPSGSGAISGMQLELTVTGPFVNKTYFEQAEVEMPGEGATWDDWAAAATEVAAVMNDAGLEVFPLTMDARTHRFAGPAISNGAMLFDDEGIPSIDDEGFRGMVEKFVGWHEDGTMFPDPWVALDGGLAGDTFANGGAAVLMSGSWKLGGFPGQIGDAFDWTVVPNPCGPGGCSGMPGGSSVVAFSGSDKQEHVAKLIDFLAQAENYETYSASTFTVPAHIGVASSGVAYETDNDSLRSSLNGFVANVPTLSPVAFQFQGSPYAFAVYGPVQDRMSQILNGELSIDEGINRMVSDIAAKLNE